MISQVVIRWLKSSLLFSSTDEGQKASGYTMSELLLPEQNLWKRATAFCAAPDKNLHFIIIFNYFLSEGETSNFT